MNKFANLYDSDDEEIEENKPLTYNDFYDDNLAVKRLKVYNKYKGYTIPQLNQKIKCLESKLKSRYGKLYDPIIEPMLKLEIYDNLNKKLKKNKKY